MLSTSSINYSRFFITFLGGKITAKGSDKGKRKWGLKYSFNLGSVSLDLAPLVCKVLDSGSVSLKLGSVFSSLGSVSLDLGSDLVIRLRVCVWVEVPDSTLGKRVSACWWILQNACDCQSIITGTSPAATPGFLFSSSLGFHLRPKFGLHQDIRASNDRVS